MWWELTGGLTNTGEFSTQLSVMEMTGTSDRLTGKEADEEGARDTPRSTDIEGAWDMEQSTYIVGLVGKMLDSEIGKSHEAEDKNCKLAELEEEMEDDS